MAKGVGYFQKLKIPKNAGARGTGRAMSSGRATSTQVESRRRLIALNQSPSKPRVNRLKARPNTKRQEFFGSPNPSYKSKKTTNTTRQEYFGSPNPSYKPKKASKKPPAPVVAGGGQKKMM